MSHLVLFDFDGTITSEDTLLAFIRNCHGTMKFGLGFLVLSPALVAMRLGLISTQQGKEMVLKFFFKGTPLSEFNKWCKEFAEEKLPGLIRPSALARLQMDVKEGKTVCVVSASPENWIQPWCEKMRIQCIATRLKVVDNRVSGEIEGLNCNGPEKVNRIKLKYSLPQFKHITAYGDSNGDTEMLAIAQSAHYRFFEKNL